MRILIAEDDPVIGLGLAQRVAALGHDPIGPVADGQKAVEWARMAGADLYLFDIDMPHLDGLAAARQLATQGLRRPVVLVTGVEDPGLVDRAIETGVAAYLTKPIDARELDAAIRLAAARHAELEALEAEVERAQQALEDRKLIERAKGLLMEALQVSEPEAFRRIQRAARDRNLRLVEVARQVVTQRSLLIGERPEPSGEDEARAGRHAPSS